MIIPDYATDIPERTLRGTRDHLRQLECQRKRREAESELAAIEAEAEARGRALEASGWVCPDY